MYDLQVSAQGTVELLAEAICPLCDAELKGDLSVSGIEARCPNCHGSLWCQMTTLGGVVVLDMMPRQTFECEFARPLRDSLWPFSGRSPVVVNLSKVEVADSTFLAGLVLLKKRTDAAGGRLILYGPRSLLREMFAFTRLAEFFVIVATEADALRMLKRGDTKQRRVVPTA
jgi:anti-anti-sigma factor